MKSEAAGAKSATLGPFLTLLVLTTSGRMLQDCELLATVETETWHSCGATFDRSPQGMETRGRAISLGPFLTLILTLHCRKVMKVDSAAMDGGTWQVGPFVRISTSS
jgi:hypothetical protein